MDVAALVKTKLAGRIFITVCVLALVGLAGYFYNQYRIAQKRLNNPQQAVADDVKALTATVGKLIVLPAEDPTVATVADVDKLKNQRFFTNALNGDKVLIFNNAKKAILYRPSINKIVEIMPINIEVSPTPVAHAPAGQVAGTTAASVTPVPPTPTPVPQPLTFAIRNGTTVTGLAKRYEAEVKSRIPTASVTSSDNAKRRDYAKTVVVGLSQTGLAQATTVAGVLGVTSGTLPTGEDSPAGADFLVIIGSDKATLCQ
jgi:hypothetical protein